ncbi:SpaH/EbpB family LPXTG-anchored major pilin [Catenibacterium sp.]|uniref:SpaH/EbpB family LPXTG-anchored major pilin n=1 Tax=Catenibacterium sp. TaxID=2049022 RepID=UPI003FD800DC
MKSIKRIIALLLTAVMTMTMSVTAFAVDSGCSLTVNVKGGQNLKEQTISLYKLFGVTESGKAPNKNYAYTVNTQYKAALASVLKINETSKDEEFAAAVTNLGNDNDTKVQNFANDFTAKALTSNLAVTATSGKITEENKTSYEFTDLDAGYYLVYVTGGKEIQSSLVTVDESTKTVNLKTEAPSITKTANKPSVNIGDVVTYTVKGSVPDTTGYDKYVYTIHDELSNGLDFVKNAKGDALDKANEVNVTVAFKDATDASTAPTTAKLDAENNRKMSLDLSAWVRANQVNNKGKEFTVTYYAKVNKDAVVTEKNSATLEYGNDPDNTTTTKPSEAQTPTYPLDIKKFKTGSDEKLAGAKFRLYSSEVDAKANDESKAIKVSPVVAGNYVVDPASTTTEFESVKSIEGKGYNLHVNGLAAGTYYLVETEAPAGYNKLTAPIKVTITKTGDTEWTISKDGTEETDKIIDVENSTGSMLPSTGGMGTIAFTVVAALLVLGVAVSFIRDRKREN